MEHEEKEEIGPSHWLSSTDPGFEPAQLFEHDGGWHGLIYVERRSDSDTLVCRMDLFRYEVPICRILQARDFKNQQDAVDVLTATAIEWIGAWNKRAAEGEKVKVVN